MSLRETYQQANDVLAQFRIAAAVGKELNMMFTPFPTHARVDFVMRSFGGEAALWLEAKHRYDMTIKTHKDIMLSADKFNGLCRLSQLQLIPWGFGIELDTDDVWLYSPFESKHVESGLIELRPNTGRTVQTRDPQDIEDCYYISTQLFRKIK